MSHATDSIKVKHNSLNLESMNSFKVLGYLARKHKFFLALVVIAVQSDYIITHLGTVIK